MNIRQHVSFAGRTQTTEFVMYYSCKMNQLPTASPQHYSDVKMGAMAFQITSLTIVYGTVYLGVDQRKDQSSASLAFVWGIHRSPVNSPHKWPVTQKMFPFDDVIMKMGCSMENVSMLWCYHDSLVCDIYLADTHLKFGALIPVLLSSPLQSNYL